jgi:hypothetical protein
MAIKYLHIPTSSIARPSKINPKWDFCFENIPSGNPGVDVMISIFCDFCQFSAKNWRFSQKQ